MYLAVTGPVTYRLLHNLIFPADKTYQELVTTLTMHFSLTRLETVQRFKFNTHIRKPGESVLTYLAELRSIAEYCNKVDESESEEEEHELPLYHVTAGEQT